MTEHTSSLLEWKEKLYSTTQSEVFEATQKFRKVLAIEHNPPITEVVNLNVAPRFVEIMQSYPSSYDLQYEAGWALTNIASGSSEHTNSVIAAGAVPVFVQLLSSTPNEEVREQVIWGLGNIAGDSATARDLVLEAGALAPILTALNNAAAKPSLLRNAVWTVANLCRGKPIPHINKVKASIPVLAKMLHSSDSEVLTDAAWALSYISDGPEERAFFILTSGVIPRLAELLSHSAASVQTPCLRTIGNICSGNDRVTAQVIAVPSIIDKLLSLHNHAKKGIRKEVCWTFSNIFAGTRDQIDLLLRKGVMPAMIKLLRGDDMEVSKEAAWCVANALSGGTPAHVTEIVQQGGVTALLKFVIKYPKNFQPVKEAFSNSNILSYLEGRQEDLDMYHRVMSPKSGDVEVVAGALPEDMMDETDDNNNGMAEANAEPDFNVENSLAALNIN